VLVGGPGASSLAVMFWFYFCISPGSGRRARSRFRRAKPAHQQPTVSLQLRRRNASTAHNTNRGRASERTFKTVLRPPRQCSLACGEGVATLDNTAASKGNALRLTRQPEVRDASIQCVQPARGRWRRWTSRLVRREGRRNNNTGRLLRERRWTRAGAARSRPRGPRPIDRHPSWLAET
jgi:hypothetical protein